MTADLEIRVIEEEASPGKSPGSSAPSAKKPSDVPGVSRKSHEDSKVGKDAADMSRQVSSIGKEITQALRDPSAKKLVGIAKSILAVVAAKAVSSKIKASADKIRGVRGKVVDGTVIRRNGVKVAGGNRGLVVGGNKGLIPRQALARPGAGAVATLGRSALAIARVAGPIGIAVGVAATGLGVMAVAVSKYSAVMRREAEELSRYSPALSFQKSLNSINLQVSKFSRARRIGDDLSSLSKTQNRIDVLSYKAQTEFYAASLQFYKAFEPLIEDGLSSLETLIELAEFMNTFVEPGTIAANAVTSWVKWKYPLLSKGIDLIRQQFEDKKDDDQAPLVDPFRGQLEKMLEAVSG